MQNTGVSFTLTGSGLGSVEAGYEAEARTFADAFSGPSWLGSVEAN